MQIWPWTRLPNIRRYYRRLAAHAWHEVVSLGWWSQVIGLLVGFAITLLQIQLKLIPPQLSWQALRAFALPYFAVLVLMVALALFRAPVAIDNRRERHLRATSYRLRTNKAAHEERLREVERERDAAGAELKKHLESPKRTPTEQHYFDTAEAEWRKLSNAGKQIVRYLWAHERLWGSELASIPGVPYEDVRVAIEGELKNVVFIKPFHNPGQDRWWQPVPAYRDVVNELLYEAR